MALATAFLSEDQFSCSICLEVFTNPVSTPCGHSFCQACISSYWDGQVGAKIYQCPLCKESFRKRPELHINRTLKEITEQFKQMASAGLAVDGSGGVENPNVRPREAHTGPPLPPRPKEMPGSIIAEMEARFRQLQTLASTQGALHHLTDADLQSFNQVSDALAQVQNEHRDPPPPYSSARRYSPCRPDH